MKQCSTAGCLGTEFGRCKTKKDGTYNRCKRCREMQRVARVLKNESLRHTRIQVAKKCATVGCNGDEFGKMRVNLDGLEIYCKDCRNKQSRDRYHQNGYVHTARLRKQRPEVKEKERQYTKTDRWKAIQKVAHKKGRLALKDWYVRDILNKKTGVPIREIPQEAVVQKRLLTTIYRMLNELS